MAQMDAAYARPELYWGREANTLCRHVCALVPPSGARGARAIDLGAGEGRDAVALARHGFQVTAVDISLPGLRKAAAWAATEGLELEIRQADILQLRLQDAYGLVYSSGTLNHLPAERRRATFDRWRAHTAPGGYHALNVFVEKPFIAPPPDWGPDEYFFRSGELLSLYWDWEVVYFEEEIFECTSSGVPHRHAMDTLIARRVAS